MSRLTPYFPPNQALAILSRLPGYALSFTRQQFEGSGMALDGVHYFDAKNNPTFDLGKCGQGIVTAQKMTNITAPKNATQGQYGAVDWLELGPKDGYPNTRISRVYRVDTASGKAPPTCQGLGSHTQIEYAALYWFYGTT